MNPRIALLAAVLAPLLTMATVATAQVHRWVDERGAVQYGDRPPSAGAKSLRVPVAPPPPPTPAAAPSDKSSSADKAPPSKTSAPAQSSLIERKLAEQAQHMRTAAAGAAPTVDSPGMRALIEQCKANRGVGCDTPHGMRELQKQNTEITAEQQASNAGLRARRATCARAGGGAGC